NPMLPSGPEGFMVSTMTARGAILATSAPPRRGPLTAQEAATAQRLAAFQRQGRMVTGSVVQADATGAYVRGVFKGVAAVRRYPLADLFLRRGGELLDGTTLPNLLTPGQEVLVPESAGPAG